MRGPALLPGTPAASFEKRTGAYSCWCGCPEEAAARIIAHDGETFDATVKRLTFVLVDDLERYLFPKEAA